MNQWFVLMLEISQSGRETAPYNIIGYVMPALGNSLCHSFYGKLSGLGFVCRHCRFCIKDGSTL
jgi:hypothetical protein